MVKVSGMPRAKHAGIVVRAVLSGEESHRRLYYISRHALPAMLRPRSPFLTFGACALHAPSPQLPEQSISPPSSNVRWWWPSGGEESPQHKSRRAPPGPPSVIARPKPELTGVLSAPPNTQCQRGGGAAGPPPAARHYQPNTGERAARG